MGDPEGRYFPSENPTEEQYPELLHSVPQSALGECLCSWLNYLQMLNGLCAAGLRVAAGIRGLVPSDLMRGPAEWEEAARCLQTATAVARARALLLLHQLKAMQPADDSSQQLTCDNILSLLNLQYGFCIATYERLTNSTSINDLQDVNVVSKFSCYSPSFQIINEDSNPRTSTPHMNITADMSRMSLEKNKNKVDFNRIPEIGICDSQNCLTDRSHDRSMDSCRMSKRDFRCNIDRTQMSQGSSSSSDGILGAFSQSDPMRLLHQSGNGIGPCNVSPLGFEPIRCPSHCSVDYLRSCRGPFPAPGMLAATKGPFVKMPRAILQPPGPPKLQPLQPRRWSEAAAHEMSEREEDGGSARRWSVPWDGGPPPPPPPKTHSSSSDCQRVWEGVWGGDSDPLTAAILLLSCRPPLAMSEPLGAPGENCPGRPRNSNTMDTSRGYSMWSGSDVLPFLRLPESLEHSDENLHSPTE